MGNNDGSVQLAFSVFLDVFSREHVDLTLIHTERADICLEVEDIRALHRGVEQLGDS